MQEKQKHYAFARDHFHFKLCTCGLELTAVFTVLINIVNFREFMTQESGYRKSE